VLRTLLVLSLAAVVVAGASVIASLPFFPATTDAIDVANGGRIFQHRCAACHSLEADGRVAYGPPLHNIGALAAKRSVDQTAAEYLWESVINPAAKKAPGAAADMPRSAGAGLGRSELMDLVAYLLSHGGNVSYAKLCGLPDLAESEEGDDTEPPPVSVAVLERGRHLYLHELKCAQCHSFDSSLGNDWLAPNLSNAGLYSKDYLRESILRPSSIINQRFEQWQLSADGLVQSGRGVRQQRDLCRIVQKSASVGVNVLDYRPEELDIINGKDVMKKLSVSAMPSYQGQIQDRDLDALLAFLSTLRGT
jgi:mono/diheme cytochrome c family protein